MDEMRRRGDWMQEVKKLGNIYGFNGGNYAGNVYDQEGLAPNFLSMEGGNRQPMIVVGSSPKHNNRVFIKQVTKTGYIECDVGGVADLSYPESKTRRGRVQNGGQVSPALTVSGVDGIRKVESPYRIRKLTPLECWRLMGFTDEDFHKAEAVNSNTQLYKQAGNSIVVDVLKAIFEQML